MACEEISTADLFDWLVPGGPVPAGKGTPDGRGTAVAAHLRGCPACRERARMLHDILCGMIERSDSGTTTIYQTQSEVEDAHQYPVSVQVLHDSRGAEAASGDLPAARTARTSPGGGPAERLETVGRGTWYGGPWAKVAGIVIIVAVLAMLVRPTAPVASGTFSGDVLKVLAQVPSAHIVATSPDCGFIYECWIAYRSGRMVRRMGRECTLYDLERGDMRTLDIQAGTWDCVKLDHIRHARIREAMVGYLGGILERISAGGGSPLPADDPASQAVENADVYELKADTGRRASRLLAYIDRVTGLPRKTELYSHVPGETRWRLATTTVFTYPSEQEVESCIQAFSRAP